MCGPTLSRRHFTAGVLCTGATLSLGLPRPGFAQSFPSQTVDITIASAEGGGTDRDGRIFTRIWQNHLDADFEFSYYPGASGLVGYRSYLNKPADPHNLLFSFMGAEVIVLTLNAPEIEIGKDIVYIQQTLSEPMAVWVPASSEVESLEQLIELSRQRPVTVSVARLPHPSSIGMLAVAEATGADFTLVPYGGGGPAAAAALTGEADCCALALTTAITQGADVRVLGVFADSNPAPQATADAPTVNQVLGTTIPPMTSSRAWALHGRTLQEHPAEVEILKRTMQQTMADPDYAPAMEAAGVPPQFINPGDQETAMASAMATRELALRFRELLSEA